MSNPLQQPPKHPVYIVQGAQWGSEGKGQVAAVVAARKGCLGVIRTGSINAGHTVFHEGREYKMQLIPTAWVIPGATLILGPGCLIHREILAREFVTIRNATGEDIRHRLKIDYRCSIHSPDAELRGHASGRHHAMGSTGKGSSDALVDRLRMRANIEEATSLLFENFPEASFKGESIDFSDCITDTARFANTLLHDGPLLLEGTQGAHLDLFTGPWPYTTNRSVSTAAWLAYAGLAPTLDVRPILVARTFPIRVAGNSGPMQNETTWPALYRDLLKHKPEKGGVYGLPLIDELDLREYEDLLGEELTMAGAPRHPEEWTPAQRINHRVALSEAPTKAFDRCDDATKQLLYRFFEMTTVTRKIRRVGRWHRSTVSEAIMLNGCSELFISFLNYMFPEDWGKRHGEALSLRATDWLQEQEQELGVTITGVSTERYPENHHDFDALPDISAQ